MFRSNQSNSGWGAGVGTSMNQDCEGRGIMKTRRGEEEREILRSHRSGIIVTLTLELEDCRFENKSPQESPDDSC